MSIIGRINVKGQNMDVLRPTYKRDAVGSRKQTFVHKGRVNGYVASRSMTEGFTGERQEAAEVVTIYVQGRADIVVTDRLRFESKTYEVTGVRVPGHRTDGDRLYYRIVDATTNEGV